MISLISLGFLPVSEEQLLQAGFSLMTAGDDAGPPLYILYHYKEAGSGAVATVHQARRGRRRDQRGAISSYWLKCKSLSPV